LYEDSQTEKKKVSPARRPLALRIIRAGKDPVIHRWTRKRGAE
jgi:hypothetical protein